MNIDKNNDMLFELTRELCAVNAVSGDEGDVRKYITEKLKNTDCEIKTDNLGNLIINKKGIKTPGNKVMLAAHMDEVGFMASFIDNDGYISISPVGGIGAAVVMGRQIRFKSGQIGVIGGKPVHLSEEDEKKEQPKISKLYADIGAASREECLAYVNPGDPAYFVSEYMEFGSGLIKGKALDDRFGCAVMLMLLLSDNEYDLCCAFTVQEEVGTRGAGAAVFNIKPDIALVIETTTACDIAGVSGEKKVCSLGEGPVVSFMDRSTVYDRELYDMAFKTAEENGIKCQTKTQIAGGNDSGAIHKAIGGIRTIAVSVPCRYLHSPSCVLSAEDCTNTFKLIKKLTAKLSVL